MGLEVSTVDTSIIDLPDDIYDSFVYLPSQILYKAIKFLNGLHNIIFFHLDNNEFKLFIKRNCLNSCYIFKNNYSNDKANQFFLDYEKKVFVEADGKSLEMVTKIYEINEQVMLFIGKDVPILIKYDITDDLKSYLKFYLIKKEVEYDSIKFNSSEFTKLYKIDLNSI